MAISISASDRVLKAIGDGEALSSGAIAARIDILARATVRHVLAELVRNGRLHMSGPMGKRVYSRANV
jgi:hypothetical protein